MLDLTDVPLADLEELCAAALAAQDLVTAEVFARAIERALRWEPQEYQQPPTGPWATWLFLAGRSTGKTDVGSFWLNAHALGPACDRRLPGGHRMRIIGPTFTDAVASCVKGPVGLIAHNREVKLVGTQDGTVARWPNGAEARIFGAFTPEDPERLRAGGNSCADWMEEFAAARQMADAWDQAKFGLRLGTDPRTIITTTPKNRPLVRELRDAGEKYAATEPEFRAGLDRDARVHLTLATSKQNRYANPDVIASLFARYAGTRLGAQELDAVILDDLGTYFSRAWFGLREGPSSLPVRVRAWDLAGTAPGPANEDPDWSVGSLVAYDPSRTPWRLADGTTIYAGGFVVEDVVRLRETPATVEQEVMNTARRDGPEVRVVVEREPGQSGKSQIAHFQQMLAGITLVAEFSPSGPKEVRAQLVSGAAQQGRVEIVRAAWNDALFDELEEFPLGPHDDQVDTLSMAFAVLEGRGGMADVTKPTARLPTRAEVLGEHRRFPGGVPRGPT